MAVHLSSSSLTGRALAPARAARRAAAAPRKARTPLLWLARGGWRAEGSEGWRVGADSWKLEAGCLAAPAVSAALASCSCAAHCLQQPPGRVASRPCTAFPSVLAAAQRPLSGLRLPLSLTRLILGHLRLRGREPGDQRRQPGGAVPGPFRCVHPSPRSRSLAHR